MQARAQAAKNSALLLSLRNHQRLRRLDLLRLLQGYLGHVILPHLICPHGHHRPYKQRGRQSRSAFLRTAKPVFCWLFGKSAAPAFRPQLRHPLNSSLPVENFNAHHSTARPPRSCA